MLEGDHAGEPFALVTGKFFDTGQLAVSIPGRSGCGGRLNRVASPHERPERVAEGDVLGVRVQLVNRAGIPTNNRRHCRIAQCDRGIEVPRGLSHQKPSWPMSSLSLAPLDWTSDAWPPPGRASPHRDALMLECKGANDDQSA